MKEAPMARRSRRSAANPTHVVIPVLHENIKAFAANGTALRESLTRTTLAVLDHAASARNASRRRDRRKPQNPDPNFPPIDPQQDIDDFFTAFAELGHAHDN